MLLRGEGLGDEQGEGLDQEKTMYVIHPNCAIEEMG